MRHRFVLGLALAAMGACGSPSGVAPSVQQDTSVEQISTGKADAETSRPSITPEIVDPTSLQQLQVQGLDGATATLAVGPRPSGGPGFCALDAFGSLPGRPQCFAPDAEGRLFMPMLTGAANVSLFMHPDVASAEVVLDGVVRDVPIIAVDGLSEVFVVVTPDEDDGVESFAAADGSDVYVAEFTPLRDR